MGCKSYFSGDAASDGEEDIVEGVWGMVSFVNNICSRSLDGEPAG